MKQISGAGCLTATSVAVVGGGVAPPTTAMAAPAPQYSVAHRGRSDGSTNTAADGADRKELAKDTADAKKN